MTEIHEDCREDFRTLEKLNHQILNNCLSTRGFDSVIDEIAHKLYHGHLHPKEIQYIGKANTRDHNNMDKKSVLQLHLDGIVDALASIGSTHMWEAQQRSYAIEFRYEGIVGFVGYVATNEAHRLLGMVDRQTDDILNYYASYAKKLGIKHNRWSEISIDEINQNSLIGLLKAIRNFPINAPVKFMTHATYYILGETTRTSARERGVVTIPLYKSSEHNGIRYTELTENLFLSDCKETTTKEYNLSLILGVIKDTLTEREQEYIYDTFGLSETKGVHFTPYQKKNYKNKVLPKLRNALQERFPDMELEDLL